jgi:hypothetical protein
MGTDYYDIIIDERVVASRVTMEWLLPFIRAIFEATYNEPDMAVYVRRWKEDG